VTDPLPAKRLRRRLEALSREERAAFVADLLAARGWTVEREGCLLTATRNGRRKRVAVGHPRGTSRVDEVVVVPPRGRHPERLGWRPERLDRTTRARRRASDVGAAVTTPDEIRLRLLYGLDRTTAGALLAEHLGIGIDDGTGSVPRPRSGDGPHRRLAVVALAAAVVLSAALIGWGLPAGDRSVRPTPGGPAGTDTAVAVPGEAVGADAVAGPAGNGSTGPPPGLAAGGLRSVDLLTRSHLEALRASRGMSMNATFAGPRFLTGFDTFRSGFDADDRVTIEVRVESPDRYLIRRHARFPGGLTGGSETTLERFADGRAEYRRIASGTDRRFDRRELSTARGGRAEVVGWTRTVFLRYLNTSESRVERVTNGLRTAYRVVATGRPRRLDHDSRDYRAVAVVTPDGFVGRLDVEYTHPRTGATVRVSVRYDRTVAAVEPPAWYETARTDADDSRDG
jgi:hypothetical protein